MKIKAYMLRNIQSWDNNSEIISLSSDTMNVLIAPSETGKSVIIKVLKEMCFAGNWNYTWESLIRYDAEYGTACFILEDDSIVMYYIWRDKVRYYIQYADKTEKLWEFKDKKHTEIPEEVANAMGLIIDRKGKTIINVIDKDMAVPFVTATPELNARLAATISEVPELEKRRDNLYKWKEQFSIAVENAKRAFKNNKIRYEEAPEIDTLKYTLELNRAERLLAVIKPLEETILYFKYTKIPVKPHNVKSPYECTDIVKCMDISESIIDILNDLKSVNKPVEVVFNKGVIDNFMSVINSVNEISLLYKSVCFDRKPIEVKPVEHLNGLIDVTKDIIKYGQHLKSIPKKPDVIKQPVDIMDILSVENCIWSYASILREVCNVSKPIEVNISEEKSIIEIIDIIDTVDIDSIIVDIQKYNKLLINLKNCEVSIENLRKELGVCPTCGKPW